MSQKIVCKDLEITEESLPILRIETSKRIYDRISREGDSYLVDVLFEMNHENWVLSDYLRINPYLEETGKLKHEVKTSVGLYLVLKEQAEEINLIKKIFPRELYTMQGLPIVGNESRVILAEIIQRTNPAKYAIASLEDMSKKNPFVAEFIAIMNMRTDSIEEKTTSTYFATSLYEFLKIQGQINIGEKIKQEYNF